MSGRSNRAALLAGMGHADDSAAYHWAPAGRGTTARAAVLAVLQGFDAETYLRSAGLSAEEVARVRSRLLA